MGKIIKNGIEYGGGTEAVDISQAQYNALSSAEKNNGKTYYIFDANPSSGSAPTVKVEGYYNSTDSKFYEEDTYTTEIAGNVDEMYISLDTNYIYRYRSGTGFIQIGGSGSGGDNTVELTTAQYNALTSTEKNNGTTYFITDGERTSVMPLVTGYFNSSDNKFYEESNYTTEITGEVGLIYVSVDTGYTYRYTGSAFSQIGNSSITVDSALNSSSENPVQNKVVKSALDDKANSSIIGTLSNLATTAKDTIVNAINEVKGLIPSKTSDLTNDSGFVTSVPTKTSQLTNDSGFLTSVSASTVGLGSVVNTGDTATPTSSGTTKFTSGGAYTELTKLDKDVPFYATCSTGASTAAKVATIANTPVAFTLAAGAKVVIKFTYTNTNSSPTLNVNSTGAKAIKSLGVSGNLSSPVLYWTAGEFVTFIYDGTNWIMQNPDTIWSSMSFYSTTAYPCGFWLSHVLYRKVIDFGTVPKATTKSVAHGCGSGKVFVKIYGYVSNGTNYWPIPTPLNTDYGITIRVEGSNLVMQNTIDLSSFSAYVVLEYY